MKFENLHSEDGKATIIHKEWLLKEFVKAIGGDDDDFFELRQYLSTYTVIYWCGDPQEEGAMMWNTCKNSLRILHNALSELNEDSLGVVLEELNEEFPNCS
jgi:hypothetical protein